VVAGVRAIRVLADCRVAAGTVLELSAAQWAYGDGPLRLRVDRDRADLSIYYDDCRWLEGWRIDDAGVPVQWLQALVPVAVILQQIGDET
jgi:hypothetical protein